MCYYKLPYLGSVSKKCQQELRNLSKAYCKDLLIKLVFTPFKIGSMFSTKDQIPYAQKSFVVYKFSCAGCGTSYIGETQRHITTRINEHLKSDKNSHIYKHLVNNEQCKSVCDDSCFKIIDKASSPFRLKD